MREAKSPCLCSSRKFSETTCTLLCESDQCWQDCVIFNEKSYVPQNVVNFMSSVNKSSKRNDILVAAMSTWKNAIQNLHSTTKNPVVAASDPVRCTLSWATRWR
uniref:Uncharacterized protein n=1 Tax=Caenorhabditis japonica TaxID=281687 RepID=A0A8R1ITZ4_CAEJA